MTNDDRVLPQSKQKHNRVKGSNSPQGDALSSAPLPLFDMYRGFLPLWRKITDWGWYKEGNTARVFIHLLLKANREQKYYLGHLIKPGQVVAGRKKLSVDLGLSEQQIRTALNHLKSTNEITTQSTSKFSIITLTNWGKHLPQNYSKTRKSTSELTSNQPASNQQVTTTNKDKKEEKDKNKKSVFNGEKFPFLTDEVFSSALKDYLEMRKKIRRPATDRAIELALIQLHKFTSATAIKMLEKSISSSWQGLYPLKDTDKPKGDMNRL